MVSFSLSQIHGTSSSWCKNKCIINVLHFEPSLTHLLLAKGFRFLSPSPYTYEGKNGRARCSTLFQAFIEFQGSGSGCPYLSAMHGWIYLFTASLTRVSCEGISWSYNSRKKSTCKYASVSERLLAVNRWVQIVPQNRIGTKDLVLAKLASKREKSGMWFN